MRRLILLGGFFLLTGCGAFSDGQTAADFNLPSVSDPAQNIRLSHLNKNHQVLLVFWATWCPSCAEEIPVLNEWNDRFHESGLRILAVNVEEGLEDIRAFQQENPMRYPVVMDENGEVMRRYGVSALPTTVFLAKGGEIRYYGFTLPPQIESLVGES